MANGQSFNLFQIIDQADRISGSPERIPQNKDIRAANEFFQGMFDYDVSTGFFKDVISPAEHLKKYKDMERNALALRLGDKMMGPVERQFKGPMFDWGSIGAGVSDILDKKRRDQVLNEVAEAQTDATRIELDAVPPRKRYKATYEGLDPEDTEDKAKIQYRARVEELINMLEEGTADRILDPAQAYAKERYGRYYQGPPAPKDLPMRSQSLQDWMFAK